MAGADTGIGKVTHIDRTTSYVLIAFTAIAFYNVIELSSIIFITFRKRSGLYFWSFVVATWAIVPYTLGFMLKNFELSNQPFLYSTLILIGWCPMVTGQSVVLYSRLHLIVRNETHMCWVRAMIIANAFICHVPIIVLCYGSNSSQSKHYVVAYSIYERLQVTLFFLQEIIISGMYIYHTSRMLRTLGTIRNQSSRKMLIHLVYVNVIIILLDITILALQYAGQYSVQTTYKSFVYSAKLKMEFSLLNGLLQFTRERDGLTYSRSDQNNNRGSSKRGHELDHVRNSKKRRSRLSKPGAGYNAYAHTKTGSFDNNNIDGQQSMSVMKTTEVVVHHEEEHAGQKRNTYDWESDRAEGPQDKSKLETERGRMSPSSTESILQKPVSTASNC